jgi:predicted dehydrogenase
MQKQITIALVGLGGYGNNYIRDILAEKDKNNCKFVAGVDPNPISCKFLEEMKTENVPIYPDIDTFYQNSFADLVIISTPIQYHEPMTKKALSHGSHVLCEKPLTGTVEEALSMLKAEQASENQVAIGYQLSFMPPTTKLKEDIMSGRFGAPIRLKSFNLGPRKKEYYERASWAGRIKTDDGIIVNDSPVMNACAHYLHNMFYLIGKEMNLSAKPTRVTSEVYRAKDIENLCTAAIRIQTDNDAEILFYSSHSTPNGSPITIMEFEKAILTHSRETDSRVMVEFKDGKTYAYDPSPHSSSHKIWRTADAIRNKTKFLCGIEAALPHVQTINAIKRDAGDIPGFPPEYIEKTGKGSQELIIVKGLMEVLKQSFDENKLPSELGSIEWAIPPRTVEI